MTQPAETVVPFFRTGNYAPVTDELTAFDLPVDGAIPPELNGWYLRNGPNPRQITGHWFTGDGMIHGVRLEHGRAAWYRNRWVRTDSFDQPVPAVQRRRHPQPAFQRRQHPRHQPRRQDTGAGGVVAALRDHQRAGHRRCLRLRRQAGRLDDGAPEDLPDHRRAALLRLRQPPRARTSPTTAPTPSGQLTSTAASTSRR